MLKEIYHKTFPIEPKVHSSGISEFDLSEQIKGVKSEGEMI
jgi:hypothetical protein